jgi:DNA gyrase subunit B
MYFGTLGSDALHQLLWSALDHAIDEASRGTCNRIKIVLRDGKRISVQDNGSGLPLDSAPQADVSSYVISPLDVIGKIGWTKHNFQASRYSLGLPVVNAASGEFEVEVKRNGFIWQQKYAKGEPLSEVKQVRPVSSNETTGTEITFVPDFSIFDPSEYDYGRISRRLRELAYLIPGLTLALADERPNAPKPYMEYLSQDGVVDFVRHINRNYEALHKPIVIRKTVELEKDYKPLGISGTFDIALQYANVHHSVILTFVNGFEVECSGPLLEGLLQAIRSTIIYSAKTAEPEAVLGVHGFTDDDCTSGLAAVLSIQHPKPETCNSIYYVLANTELEDAVLGLVHDAIDEFANGYPDQMKRIIEKCAANKALRFQRRYHD